MLIQFVEVSLDYCWNVVGTSSTDSRHSDSGNFGFWNFYAAVLVSIVELASCLEFLELTK